MSDTTSEETCAECDCCRDIYENTPCCNEGLCKIHYNLYRCCSNEKCDLYYEETCVVCLDSTGYQCNKCKITFCDDCNTEEIHKLIGCKCLST